MDYFVWSTGILTAWAALGPLLGVRYGQELARQWQRQHWINDNARQECRELISVMADTFSVLLKYYTPSIIGSGTKVFGPHDERDKRELEQAQKTSVEIFYRHLFIANQLNALKVRNRWMAAIDDFEKSKDASKFADEFGIIVGEVRTIAQTFIN
jgi:hypothetical protein